MHAGISCHLWAWKQRERVTATMGKKRKSQYLDKGTVGTVIVGVEVEFEVELVKRMSNGNTYY